MSNLRLPLLQKTDLGNSCIRLAAGSRVYKGIGSARGRLKTELTLTSLCRWLQRASRRHARRSQYHLPATKKRKKKKNVCFQSGDYFEFSSAQNWIIFTGENKIKVDHWCGVMHPNKFISRTFLPRIPRVTSPPRLQDLSTCVKRCLSK